MDTDILQREATRIADFYWHYTGEFSQLNHPHHTRLASMVSMSVQEQRDLLELLVYSLGQLLVEPDFDVEELGEQATLHSIDYSYWYFLEKII